MQYFSLRTVNRRNKRTLQFTKRIQDKKKLKKKLHTGDGLGVRASGLSGMWPTDFLRFGE